MNIVLTAAEAYQIGINAAKHDKPCISLAIPALQLLVGRQFDKEAKSHILNACYQGYASVMNPDGAYTRESAEKYARDLGRATAELGLPRKPTFTLKIIAARKNGKSSDMYDFAEAVSDAFYIGYDEVKAEAEADAAMEAEYAR